MKIIALIGPAGSGKTTLANLLSNCGWQTTKFATPIKLMLTDLLAYQGIDRVTIREMIEESLKEIPTEHLNGKTPRYAMQTLGTEWRNLIDQNLWVDIWKRSISSFPFNSKIVVDDCRFIHEAIAVRQELDGKLIAILRPNNPNAIQSTHPSETEIPNILYDKIIINDKTPEHMLDELQTIIEYWK